jgi:23S rRNA pseudouridine1911/1915/1917 synthase
MDTSPLIDRLVALFPGARKTTLRTMLSSGRVLINGVTAKSLRHPVGAKDKVEVLDIALAPARSATLAEGLKLVYFDGDVVVVEKPAGLLTSTHGAEKRPTALRILQTYFSRQNGKNEIHLVHRLDRDASGLLVFARNWDSHAALKEQFFHHTITRRYDLIVHGVPKGKTGKLEHLLIEDQRTGDVSVTRNMKAGKPAVLDYEVIAADRAGRRAHVRCTLFTGRKHQIRVQMKALGHIICGDPKYGKGAEPPGRLALHAGHLTFAHPRTRKTMSFDQPMPGSFASLLRQGGHSGTGAV